MSSSNTVPELYLLDSVWMVFLTMRCLLSATVSRTV